MRLSLATKVTKKGSFKLRIDSIKKEFKGKKEVSVGLIAGLSDPKVIQYGAYNEFGTVHIPERSFIRSSVKTMQPEIKKISKKGIKALVVGKGKLEPILEAVGKAARDEIQSAILSNIQPPLEPETIKRKGHGDTLIDSGALFDNITYEVR